MCMVAGRAVAVRSDLVPLVLWAGWWASLWVALDRQRFPQTGRRVPALSPAGRVGGASGYGTRDLAVRCSLARGWGKRGSLHEVVQPSLYRASIDPSRQSADCDGQHLMISTIKIVIAIDARAPSSLSARWPCPMRPRAAGTACFCASGLALAAATQAGRRAGVAPTNNLSAGRIQPLPFRS